MRRLLLILGLDAMALAMAVYVVAYWLVFFGLRRVNYRFECWIEHRPDIRRNYAFSLPALWRLLR